MGCSQFCIVSSNAALNFVVYMCKNFSRVYTQEWNANFYSMFSKVIIEMQFSNSLSPLKYPPLKHLFLSVHLESASCISTGLCICLFNQAGIMAT